MKCTQITTFAANGKAYPEIKEVSVTSEADEARQLESGVLNLYPDITYQTIEGFGGAMTETSAYLFSQMTAETRKKALAEFFGIGGQHLRFLRVHMDSCDYSLEEYAAVEDPIADPELTTFSLKRDQNYILPVLKEALLMAKEVHPEEEISVLLSPWSPPAAWKTPPARPKNDAAVYGGFPGFMMPEIDYDHPSRCNGGSLRPEYYASWEKH